MSGAGRTPAVAAATAFLKTLANEQRLQILCQLADGEQSVSEIGEALDLAQSSVSAQLMRLRAEGLVGSRRHGRHVYYSLGRPEVIAVISLLQSTFCAPGEHLAPLRTKGD
ncbi:ArsR/SmtB family transcription factor [Tropicimonas sp.]|uniref:ArsR/SmtB family transcription factor n=1 Tax=Tropicimonas sp. TaxID=2067044 RepID=UPI003A854B69